jgi:hypothetical protein
MEERLENGRGRVERGERGLVNYYQKMRIKNNEASKRARLKRRIKQVGGSVFGSVLWTPEGFFPAPEQGQEKKTKCLRRPIMWSML